MLKSELSQFIIALLAVSVMFTIASGEVIQFPLMVFTVGIGFIGHELAHKLVAQRFGLHARFHADMKMLLMGIVLSFTGFIFAAPGAVYTTGATRAQHGIIALAGPLTNLALAVVFFFTPLTFGTHINALLAVFNLIPFAPFDGASVWQWNKIAWTIAIVASGVLLLL